MLNFYYQIIVSLLKNVNIINFKSQSLIKK